MHKEQATESVPPEDPEEDPYDREKWQEEKYGEDIKYLDRETFQTRYSAILASVSEALRDVHEESMEEYGVPFDIDAVLIYGSYGRSARSQEVSVHDKSDVDIITLSHKEPVSLRQVLKARVQKFLRKRTPYIELDFFDDIVYTDEEDVDQSIVQLSSMMDEPLVLVGSKYLPETHEKLREFVKRSGWDIEVLFV